MKSIEFDRKLSFNNWEKFSLLGKVKSVTIETNGEKEEYTFNEKGNVVSGWKQTKEVGASDENIIFTYDKNNNRIQAENIEKGIKFISKYDEFNNEIEWNEYIAGELVQTCFYLYDKENKLIESKLFHHKNNIEKKVVFRYDSHKNIIEEHTYYSEVWNNSVYMKYDERGNCISLNQEFEDKDIINKTDWEYDEKNNVITRRKLESFFGAENITETFFTNEYQYDKMYNWIKKMEYKQGINHPIRIIERKVKYV